MKEYIKQLCTWSNGLKRWYCDAPGLGLQYPCDLDTIRDDCPLPDAPLTFSIDYAPGDRPVATVYPTTTTTTEDYDNGKMDD